MDIGSLVLLILALIILGPALLFWLNVRFMSKVRRDEIKGEEQHPHAAARADEAERGTRLTREE